MNLQWWCSAQGVPWTWTWQAYPGVWLTMAALSFGYIRLLRQRDARTFPFRGALGLLLVWLSLDWPLGVLGVGYLASVHAIKFLILAFVAPPLLLSDVTAPVEAYLTSQRRGAGVFRALTHPLVAALVFNAVLIGTHVPKVVDVLAASQGGAFLNDALWFSSGVLFWWPAYSPSRLRHKMLKIVYVFFGAVSHNGLAMAWLLAKYPSYSVYELAPRIGHLTARTDQALAGTAMLFGGTFTVFYIIGRLFVQFWREERTRA